MKEVGHALWGLSLLALCIGAYAVSEVAAQDTAPLEVEVKEHVDHIIVDKALYDQLNRIEAKLDWILSKYPDDSEPKGVNINEADYEELQTVPGIGPVTAGSIVAERGQGGPFTNWEELQRRVSGVGPSTIANIKASGAVLE